MKLDIVKMICGVLGIKFSHVLMMLSEDKLAELLKDLREAKERITESVSQP